MSCPELASRWIGYLSSSRVKGDDDRDDKVRSPFHKDYDRILFSPAFRRLQDKTQVYPLAQDDYVRRRLTHSLEVASIGRCLGRSVADTLQDRELMPSGIDRDAIGSMVAAACLAHDIGNPPFGHAGEKAIQKWFKNPSNEDKIKENIKKNSDSNEITEDQLADFQNFDGNAQGFRILTSLEDNPFYGGMCLTAGTLSTFVKYPVASPGHKNNKKIGIFQSELDSFKSIANICKIKPSRKEKEWNRNPLNYLMEAADDICYLCADVEDAHKMSLLSFEESKNLLEAIDNNYKKYRYDDKNEYGKICYLVANAIGKLRKETTEVFNEKFDAITTGEYPESLMESIPSLDAVKKIRNRLNKVVIKSSHMAKIEIMGCEIITYFLDNLIKATIDQEKSKRDGFCERFLRIVTDMPDEKTPRYKRLLRIIDFISGMTDSYALQLYQELRGIRQPVF